MKIYVSTSALYGRNPITDDIYKGGQKAILPIMLDLLSLFVKHSSPIKAGIVDKYRQRFSTGPKTKFDVSRKTYLSFTLDCSSMDGRYDEAKYKIDTSKPLPIVVEVMPTSIISKAFAQFLDSKFRLFSFHFKTDAAKIHLLKDAEVIKALDRLVKEWRVYIKHELGHFVQQEFLKMESPKKNGPNYSHDMEIGPNVSTEADDFLRDFPPKASYVPRPIDIDKWIANSEFFQDVKAKDTAKFNMAKKEFYRLISN